MHTHDPLRAGLPHLKDSAFAYRLLLFFVAVPLFILSPDVAFALDPLSSTICTVVGWFTGGMGRAIATLGIVVVGVGALLGKVSWQIALTVAVGISIMFSGAQVVDALVTLPQNAVGLCPVGSGPSAGALQEALCNLAQMANSDTGRAISTLSVILVGISALMGKISAGLGITTAVGIAAVTNGDVIAQQLGEALGVPFGGCSPG